MSFDLINTSAIFQVYINHVLHDLVDDFYIVYFDNILVFLKSKKALSTSTADYKTFIIYRAIC